MSNILSRTFRSLDTRNFRLFFIGQTTVALILLALQLTKSGFAVGAISPCQFGPMLLLSLGALRRHQAEARRVI